MRRSASGGTAGVSYFLHPGCRSGFRVDTGCVIQKNMKVAQAKACGYQK